MPHDADYTHCHRAQPKKELYLVRVLLLRLPPLGCPEVMLQNSAEYQAQHDAAEMFNDLMRQMPAPLSTVKSQGR